MCVNIYLPITDVSILFKPLLPLSGAQRSLFPEHRSEPAHNVQTHKNRNRFLLSWNGAVWTIHKAQTSEYQLQLWYFLCGQDSYRGYGRVFYSDRP